LGEAHITPERIAHLKRTLPPSARLSLLKDIKLAPVWMHQHLRDLAEGATDEVEFSTTPSR
jgi:hypothetical protein